MNVSKLAVWIWFALLIAACSTVVQTPKSPQEAINEARIAIIATAGMISDNLQNGLITKQDAQGELDNVKAFSGQVDEAEQLLKDGQAVLAGDRARLVNTLIQTLQKRVAEKAKE